VYGKRRKIRPSERNKIERDSVPFLVNLSFCSLCEVKCVIFLFAGTTTTTGTHTLTFTASFWLISSWHKSTDLKQVGYLVSHKKKHISLFS
jgi:hypothetical protein